MPALNMHPERVSRRVRTPRSVTQPWYCWQVGPDTSLFRGGGDSGHYRMVSSTPGLYPRDVSSAHPSHPPKRWQQEMPPDIASCLLGDKEPLVKNDCPSCQPGHGAPALNPGGPEFSLWHGLAVWLSKPAPLSSSFQIPRPSHLSGESFPPPGPVCGGAGTTPKKCGARIKHSRNGVYNYNLDYLNLGTSCSCSDLHHKRTLCPFPLFPGGREGREGRQEI